MVLHVMFYNLGQRAGAAEVVGDTQAGSAESLRESGAAQVEVYHQHTLAL